MKPLDLNEAAKELGYSVSGLRKLIRAGRGPRFTRAGGRGHFRFRQEWLDEFQEQGALVVSAKEKRPELVGPQFQIDRSLLDL